MALVVVVVPPAHVLPHQLPAEERQDDHGVPEEGGGLLVADDSHPEALRDPSLVQVGHDERDGETEGHGDERGGQPPRQEGQLLLLVDQQRAHRHRVEQQAQQDGRSLRGGDVVAVVPVENGEPRVPAAEPPRHHLAERTCRPLAGDPADADVVAPAPEAVRRRAALRGGDAEVVVHPTRHRDEVRAENGQAHHHRRVLDRVRSGVLDGLGRRRVDANGDLRVAVEGGQVRARAHQPALPPHRN
mmetsp:Transcript_29573/g.50136  ORF Transcript_29573/g.50136 Transcript_29573/m.50136 type:complete len:244 (+) Transcript_29573:471-1202(+)